MSEERVVRDVGTLVEFAPTEPPPPVPEKSWRGDPSSSTQPDGDYQKYPRVAQNPDYFRPRYSEIDKLSIPKLESSAGYSEITRSKFDPGPSSGGYSPSSEDSDHYLGVRADRKRISLDDGLREHNLGRVKGIFMISNDESTSPSLDYTRSTEGETESTEGHSAPPPLPPKLRLLDQQARSGARALLVRQAMSTICSSLYGLIVSAIGIAFAMAHLIMYSSSSFDINIYLGFLMFLFTVGIILQLLFLFKKMCDACDAYFDHQYMADYVFRSFGSEGFRIVAGVFGVAACFWILLEFVWRIDMSRERDSLLVCAEGGMEIGTFGLALIYTLLHLFVGFYNTKLLVIGYEGVVAWGLMHLVATDVCTWAYVSAHLSLMSLINRNHSNIQGGVCDSNSPISSLIAASHPYFGLIVLVFFLWSAALLLSIFLHYKRQGSFLLNSAIDQILKNTRRTFNLKANTPGLAALSVMSIGALILSFYHHTLIARSQSDVAWLGLESVSVGMEGISITLSVAGIFAHSYSIDGLSRPVTFESITLLVSLFFTFLHDSGVAIAAIRLGQYLHYWTAAAAILEIIEVWIQSAFLLSALRNLVKYSSDGMYQVQQSGSLYLIGHNLWMAIFAIFRQRESLYGEIMINGLGLWIWAIWRFWLKCFIVIYRLFAAACFGSLWIRSVQG